MAIIDPHHHLWDLSQRLGLFPEPRHPFIASVASTPYYTFDALRGDAQSGHRVIGTVFVECGAFYSADLPAALQSVGEVQFASGVAAQGASGIYGEFRPCAAIVGHADLSLGDGVAEVLEAKRDAGHGRFRGIRHSAAWDGDRDTLGPVFDAPQGLLTSDAFCGDFRHLAPLGMSFDAWVLEPQIGDVISLARAFPETSIVLDHCGTPLNIGVYKGTLGERFGVWRAAINELATCPNVSVKLGWLGMAFCGMPDNGPEAGVSSEALAEMWRPYIETCILEHRAFNPAHIRRL